MAVRRSNSQQNRGEQQLESWKKKAVRFLAGFVVFATTYSLILPAITLDLDRADEEPGIEISAPVDEVTTTDVDELSALIDETLASEDGEEQNAPSPDAEETEAAAEQPESSPAPEAEKAEDDSAADAEEDPKKEAGEDETSDEDAEKAADTEDAEADENAEAADAEAEDEDEEEEDGELPEESDPTADVESAEEWDEMFTPLLRSLDWSENLVRIARAQLGYRESKANFIEDENGVRHGYTRYGAWSGDPYADWNGSFVAFCLNYTDIPEKFMLRDTDVTRYAEAFDMGGALLPSTEFTPRAGDLVFFDTDHDEAHSAELVGIVVSVKADEEGRGSFHAILGLPGHRVKERSYAIDDASICGFVALPENPEIMLAAMPAQDFTGETDSIRVSVSADALAFPANTTMIVQPVEDAETLSALAAAGNARPGGVLAVDITFYDPDGNEIEPAIPIRVSLSSKLVETAKEPVVVHMDDGGDAQVVDQIDGASADDEVVFSAGSFSVYGIVDSIVTEYVSANGNLYNVVVSYDQSAQIPDGATVSITEFDETDETFLQARSALLRSMGEDEEGLELLMTALDITLHDALGNEIEPAAPVHVQLTIKALPGVDDLDEIKDQLMIQHHIQNGDDTIVETVFSGDTTANFSLQPEEAYKALYGSVDQAAADPAATEEESADEIDTHEDESSDALEAPAEENSAPAESAETPVEELAAPVEESSEEQPLTASFETDSFSVFTVRWGAVTAAGDLQNGKYILYALDASDGKYYALKPNGNGDPVAVEISFENGLISYPGGNKNELYWSVSKTGSGDDARYTFSYSSGGVTHYLRAGTNGSHVESSTSQGNHGTPQSTKWGQWSGFVYSALNTFLQCHEGVFRVRNVLGDGNWQATSRIYFEREISGVTVHYVDQDGNELAVKTGNPDSQSNYAYLIYDIEDYDYVRTYIKYRSGGTTRTDDIYPLINKSNGKYCADEDQSSFSDLPSGAEVYVEYKPRPASTYGGTPVPITDTNVATPPAEPTVTKTSTVNGDGTNTLYLSVTGHTAPIKTYRLADVLIVFDISGSMSYRIDSDTAPDNNKESRSYIAKQAIKELADTLYAKNEAAPFDKVIRMGLVTFSNDADVSNIGFTHDKNTFLTELNSKRPGGGTNWESALKLADEMTFDHLRASFVIFVTDGDPTFRYSRMLATDAEIEQDGIREAYTQYNDYGPGNADPNSANFDAALAYAQSIMNSRKHFYGIGISTDVTKLGNFVTASGAGTDHCVIAANEAQLNAAFRNIGASILGVWGEAGMTVDDGITEMTQTVRKTNMVGILPAEDDFVYSKERLATAEEIADSSKIPVGAVIEDRSGVKYTVWNNWNPADEFCGLARYVSDPTDPKAGSVIWNMGDSFMLEEGVTYKVAFKVWPSQEAYDIIAKLNNGVLKMDSANTKILYADGSEAYDSDIYNQIGGSYPNYYLITNNHANYSYSQVINSGGTVSKVDNSDKNGTIIYDVDNLSLTTQPLKVQKNWQASMYASNLRQKPDSLDIDLYTIDGGSNTTTYKTITLGPPIGADGRPDKTVNEWKNDSEPCYVSYGLLKRNGSALTIYETGHDFTLVEHYNQSSSSDLLKSHYWQLNPGTYRPMVVGIGSSTRKTILEKIDNPAGIALSGSSPGYWHDDSGALERRYMKDTYPSYTGDYYWLADANGVYHAYIDTGADVILLATNLQRSFVDLKKVVQTVDGNPIDMPVEWFSFTGTVVADYTGMTPAEIETNREDVIWVSFSDENGNSIDMTTLPKQDEWSGFWVPSDLAARDGIDPAAYYSLDPGYRLVDSGVPFYFKIKNGWSVRLVNLTNGTTVEFTETDIPEDYAFVSSSLTLTTGSGTNLHTPTAQSGTSIKVTVEQPDSGYTVTYVNKPDSAEKITILKTNENGSVPLADAEFTLYTEKGYNSTPRQSVKTGLKSGADGKIELGWLPGGTYYLLETKAPAGYMLRSLPVKIVVMDGMVTYDESTTYSQSGVGYTGSHDTGFTLVVTNWKGKTLPETGGVGTKAYTLSGAALLLTSALFLLRRFRRRREVDTC